jgi:hypothetical protein
MRTLGRIGLSFGCVLLSVLLFFLRGVRFSAHAGQLGSLVQFGFIGLIVALPVWLLALPLVVALKDAEGWRGWVILLGGVSIGPSFILVWILIATGGRFNWKGDGYSLFAAFAISSLTTLFYLLALKFFRWRSKSAGE